MPNSWCVCLQVMMAVGACSSPGVPVIGCYLNPDKRFAFVEFRNVEEASNAMAFDGVGCQVGAGQPQWGSKLNKGRGSSSLCVVPLAAVENSKSCDWAHSQHNEPIICVTAG